MTQRVQPRAAHWPRLASILRARSAPHLITRRSKCPAPSTTQSNPSRRKMPPTNLHRHSPTRRRRSSPASARMSVSRRPLVLSDQVALRAVTRHLPRRRPTHTAPRLQLPSMIHRPLRANATWQPKPTSSTTRSPTPMRRGADDGLDDCTAP